MMPASRPLRPLAALLAMLLLAGTLPVLANHTQSAGGKSIAFDHVTGNEWWVEVKVTGPDAAGVTAVDAQDTNGPWTALAKKSWGPYAASFHIEPGHEVRFRASFADGTQIVSCPFTHPGGLESQIENMCAGSSGSGSQSRTTTTHGDPCEAFGTCPTFDATFSGVRGNEWWVQATVKGANLAKVEATIDGGTTFKALAKQSWGGYAASFRVVQGSTVQLRATDTAGATDLSACYRWIPASNTDATVVACPGGGSSSSSSSTSSSATTTTAPPRTWSTRTVGQVGGFQGPLVAADVDADGNGDVVLLGEGLRILRPTGFGTLDTGLWFQGEFGNADNDLRQELYTVGIPDGAEHMEVQRVSFHDGFLMQPFFQTTDMIGPLHITDMQGDGLQELYVAHDRMQTDGRVHATIDIVPVGDVISEPVRQVVDLGDGGRGDFLTVMAIGSGNFSGVPTMLVLAYTFTETAIETQVFAIRDDAGTLRAERIGAFEGDPMFLEVADVDADGEPELLTATTTQFHVFEEAGDAWGHTVHDPLPTAMAMDADFADGDGDGTSELYVAADDGRLHVVSAGATGALVARSITTVATGADHFGPIHVVVGNGDADAAPDVYTLTLVMASFEDIDTLVRETSFGASTFDATFTGVKGNNWWVQATVTGTEPVTAVDARVNCGAWRPLAKQSYGWSASFNVPSGAKVDFRATSTSGATDLSGGYVWPNATPTTGC